MSSLKQPQLRSIKGSKSIRGDQMKRLFTMFKWWQKSCGKCEKSAYILVNQAPLQDKDKCMPKKQAIIMVRKLESIFIWQGRSGKL